MQLGINTDKKTVTVFSAKNVTIGELVDTLDALGLEDDWEIEFEKIIIEVEVEKEVIKEIIREPFRYPYYYPGWYPGYPYYYYNINNLTGSASTSSGNLGIVTTTGDTTITSLGGAATTTTSTYATNIENALDIRGTSDGLEISAGKARLNIPFGSGICYTGSANIPSSIFAISNTP